MHDAVCGELDRYVRSLQWASRDQRPKVVLVADERRDEDCGPFRYDVAVHESGIESSPPDENASSFFPDIWHRGVDSLPVAISRALCFGSFSESAISIAYPRSGARLPFTELIPIEHVVSNFDVRVDGGVCLEASGDVDNATQICSYQPGSALYLNTSIAPESDRTSWNIELTLEIRSNLYGKSISRSKVHFIIDASVPAPADLPTPSGRPVVPRQIILA